MKTKFLLAITSIALHYNIFSQETHVVSAKLLPACGEMTSLVKNTNKTKVFPVPGNQSIRILTEENIQKITISDLNGRSVLTQEALSSDETISLLGISEGFYIISIQIQDKIYQEKIIIKR